MNALAMLTIAGKAEQGFGTDRELDCLVAAAIGWVGVPHGDEIIMWHDEHGMPRDDVPCFTGNIDHARSLLPWKPHPQATFSVRTIQTGSGDFSHFAEFTWPSTECQGRSFDQTRATLACALRAVHRTHEELAAIPNIARAR